MTASLLRRCAPLVLALAIVGCGREPEPAPESELPPAVADTTATTDTTAADVVAPPVNPFAEPARRALRIELGLDDFRTLASAWSAGDATSTFIAFFAGDTLRLIEEEMSLGEHGTAHAVYYFDADGLFYVVKDEARTRLGPGEAGSGSLRTRVVFGPGGRIRHAERAVNGEAEPVPEVEAVGLREHAAALREQLRAAAVPPA